MQNTRILINGLVKEHIKFDEDIELSKLTNTRTGGIIRLIIYPKAINELKFTLSELRKNNLESIILGDMTNVAIASAHLNFVVVDMTEYLSEPMFDEESSILDVSAGYKMKALSQWALDHSISGLQWMEGIPGTVGAGTYMNAGFLPGQDFQSYLVNTTVLMPDLSIRVITNREMNFSYRRTILQENKGIVLSTKFLLRKGKKWKIAARMMQYHRRRAKNQPLNLPSAGTVFVPPTPYHVGGMLPKLGLVGYRIGGAQISEKSPGFIVGIDHMTGEDYYALVRFVQKQIRDSYGMELEPEVRLLGFETVNGKK